MKTIAKLALAATLAMGATTAASAVGFVKIGPRVGMEVSSLKFNKSLWASDNRAGFTGGVMAEFTVPVIGVGCDISAMYVRRNSRFLTSAGYTVDNNRDYFDIPLNLKYKVNIPAVNHIIRPFVTTGPAYAVMCGHNTVKDSNGTVIGENKKSDWSWNFGLGLEIMSHLQLSAQYGLGLSKALDATGVTSTTGIDGKNRYWTVTAAWLF